MVNQLDNLTKEQFSEVYKLWSDNKQEIRGLNEINKDAIKTIAEKLDCKSKVIRSAFRYMQILKEKGEDELSDIFDLMNKTDANILQEEDDDEELEYVLSDSEDSE